MNGQPSLARHFESFFRERRRSSVTRRRPPLLHTETLSGCLSSSLQSGLARNQALWWLRTLTAT